jgi:type IV pilus assembly protein PilA
MRKLFENMKKKQEGFTLIELIIVIAILAIIAAIAIPNILGAVDNSRRSADVANAKMILNAAAQVQAKNAGLTDIDGTYIIDDSIAGESGAGTDAATFGGALETTLNNAVPEPKFQGNDFVLVVSGDGTMSVRIDSAGGTEVAPNAHSDYEQQ